MMYEESAPVVIVTFTVFFCGTSGTLSPATTQIGSFYRMCQGPKRDGEVGVVELYEEDLVRDRAGAETTIRIAAERVGNAANDARGTAMDGGARATVQHFLMGFDGCGQTDGAAGTLFAFGLARQCQAVADYVDLILEHFVHHPPNGGVARLKVNVVGLSRGGIAAMFLCQLLSSTAARPATESTSKAEDLPPSRRYDPSFLSIHALLFDPVPGNLVSTAKAFDCFRFFVANKCMDLRRCECLKHVLAIYPNEPLPDLAFHAPVFGRYSSRTGVRVDEDVTLGCHQGALFNNGNDLSCRLSFVRIYRFLEEHGSPLRHGERQPRGYVDEYLQQVMGGQSIEQVERRCLNELNEVYASASEVAPTFRLGHVHGCCKCISVLARGEDHDLAPTPGGATRAPITSLNRHHLWLKQKYGGGKGAGAVEVVVVGGDGEEMVEEEEEEEGEDSGAEESTESNTLMGLDDPMSFRLVVNRNERVFPNVPCCMIVLVVCFVSAIAWWAKIVK
jgi:hypothetical protein